MRSAIVALAVTALIAGAACGPPPGSRSGQGGNAPHDVQGIWANSVFGSVDIKQTSGLCAGRVQLAQGAATVNDACFTGDTNIVLCTDTTAANAVQCAASNGKLALAGNGSDLINYARVR